MNLYITLIITLIILHSAHKWLQEGEYGVEWRVQITEHG